MRIEFFSKDLRCVRMHFVLAEARRRELLGTLRLRPDTPRGVSPGSDSSSPQSISPPERIPNLEYYGRRLTPFHAALLAESSDGFIGNFQFSALTFPSSAS